MLGSLTQWREIWPGYLMLTQSFYIVNFGFPNPIFIGLNRGFPEFLAFAVPADGFSLACACA